MSHDKTCEALLMPPDMNRAQLCHCRLREVAAELSGARGDTRVWMARYSVLFSSVSCGIAPGGLFYDWQREVDEAYTANAAPQEPQP